MSLDTKEKILLFFELDVNENATKQLIENNEINQNTINLIESVKSIKPTIFGADSFFNSLNEDSFIKKLLVFSSENTKEDSLDFIKRHTTFTNNDTEFKTNQKFEVLVSIIVLIRLFIQENCHGPSFFFIKETEKVDYAKRLSEFTNSILFKIEATHPPSKFHNYLSLSGERAYRKIALSLFFYLSNEGIKLFEGGIVELWRARLLYLQCKMLEERIFSTKEEIFNSFDVFYNEYKEKLSKRQKALYLMEKANYSIRFFKYIANKELLMEVYELLDLKLELTGVKGKKTKFQVESTTQLILSKKDYNELKLEDNKTDYSNQFNHSKQDQSNQDGACIEEPIQIDSHKNITLDEVNPQNPLLENIIVDEVLEDYTININDQLYVSTLLSNYKRSYADEDLIREEIKAYAKKCLTVSYDWLVFSKLLLHRSVAEDKQTKTIERSLLQIKSLCDQHNDREPAPFQRSAYTFTIDYPFSWEMKKRYADMWKAYGSTMSAYEIYSELEMWEEAIICLYVADKKGQAKELAEAKMKINGVVDPGILCCLGELNKEPKYFYEAIEVSNGSFTKAYRCLGHYFFNSNDLNKALVNYEKALEINPMFPGIWFTVGCIYLRLKNWEKAVSAFTQNVSMDDESAESWANLAIAFSQINKLKESLNCLDQAYKRNTSNWKVLENILVISVNDKNLKKLVFSIERLYALERIERMKPVVFSKVIEFFINMIEDSSSAATDVKYYQKKILELFELFVEYDGAQEEVWELYSNFVELTYRESVIDYKALIDLRVKQIRCLKVKNPESSKFNIISVKVKNLLNNIKDEENYKSQIIDFLDKNVK